MQHDEHPPERPIPDFVCRIVGVDEARFEIQKRGGEVVYARPVSGRLPAPLSNVLVRSDLSGFQRALLGRPRRGEFAPLAATLRVVSGSSYAVTILATFARLGALRPHLRDGLRPPRVVDESCVPIAIEGLSSRYRPMLTRFRPLGGELTAGWTAEAERELGDGMEYQRVVARAMALRPLGQLGEAVDARAIAELLQALSDEAEMVRATASQALRAYAHLLPIEPFRAVVRDSQRLNAEACAVAAAVFGAHPFEVDPETLVELFRDAPDETTAILAVRAMGRFGERSPTELLGRILLASHEAPPHEYRWMDALRVRRAAANALRALGELAPVEALIAGLHDSSTAIDAAHALLAHPGPASEAMLREARAIANGEKRSISAPYRGPSECR